MAVDTKVSLLISSISAVLIFSAMQLYKPTIASSQVLTIVGGFGGSWFFLLSLTAISNLESIILGKGFQSKIFPEVAICMLSAIITCGMIHRVCVTTCVLFSALGLYYINRISQKHHAAPVVVELQTKKRKNK